MRRFSRLTRKNPHVTVEIATPAGPGDVWRRPAVYRRFLMTHMTLAEWAPHSRRADHSGGCSRNLDCLIDGRKQSAEPRVSMQRVETRIYSEVGNPSGSFLYRLREPSERVVTVAKGCMDNAELVREKAFVAPQPHKIAGDACGLTSILKDGKRMAEPCEHHGAVR